MKTTIVTIGLAAALLSGCAASSTAAKTKDAAPKAAASAKAKATTKAKAGAPAKAAASSKVDGDWELVSFQSKKEITNDFTGTARIRYNGKDANGGTNLFTVTLLKKATQDVVATLNGSASDVKPGKIATVTLLSTDKYVAGSFDIEFQKSI